MEYSIKNLKPLPSNRIHLDLRMLHELNDYISNYNPVYVDRFFLDKLNSTKVSDLIHTDPYKEDAEQLNRRTFYFSEYCFRNQDKIVNRPDSFEKDMDILREIYSYIEKLGLKLGFFELENIVYNENPQSKIEEYLIMYLTRMVEERGIFINDITRKYVCYMPMRSEHKVNYTVITKEDLFNNTVRAIEEINSILEEEVKSTVGGDIENIKEDAFIVRYLKPTNSEIDYLYRNRYSPYGRFFLELKRANGTKIPYRFFSDYNIITGETNIELSLAYSILKNPYI